MADNPFMQYQVITLCRDINPVLRKGMQGVILEILDAETFITEFLDDEGFNYEYEGQFTFDLKSSDFANP